MIGIAQWPQWTHREAVGGIGLGGICLLLGILVAAEISQPADTSENVKQPVIGGAISTAEAAPAPAATASPLAESLADITARPLFSPTRRPSQHAEEAAGQAEDLVLAGIVVSGTDRIALFKHAQDPKIVRLKEGQSVDGWSVVSISADRVVIENAGTHHELRFGRKSAHGNTAGSPG